MFGLFRSQPKFNGTVDTKLNNEYQIHTKQDNRFPDPALYLRLLNDMWQLKASEDEAAMYIAALFYRGLLKAGYRDEALLLQARIIEVGVFGVEHGMISRARFEQIASEIRTATDDFLR